MEKTRRVKSVKRKDIKVNEYERTNEVINRLIDEDESFDETVWMVNGPVGRKPIFANTKDEAIDDYLMRFYSVEEENDLEMDCV